VDVGGRKADGAPAPVAVRHPSAHIVRSTQQPRRQFQIAAAERLADASAAHSFAVQDVAVIVRDLETVTLSGSDQHGEITGAAMAEAKIVTDHQIADAQVFDQQGFDEGLRRHGR